MATIPIENAAGHIAGVIQALTQPEPDDILAAGLYLRGEIRDRTFSGTAVDGSPFVGYSPAYAKKKEQENVDLYSRGPSAHMLDALMARTDGAVLYLGVFGDGQMAARAQAHNEGATIRTRQGKGKKSKSGSAAAFTMPQREWLGANPQDITAMGRIIAERMVTRAQKV